MKNAIRLVSILCAAACLGFQAACAGEVAQPSGEAAVKEVAETTKNSAKSLAVQYSLCNTGSLRITRSAVDFCARTAAHSYYFTAIDKEAIPPGGTIYAAASVEYYAATESLTPGSVQIIGTFFE
jgi:hypothetical protein